VVWLYLTSRPIKLRTLRKLAFQNREYQGLPRKEQKSEAVLKHILGERKQSIISQRSVTETVPKSQVKKLQHKTNTTLIRNYRHIDLHLRPSGRNGKHRVEGNTIAPQPRNPAIVQIYSCQLSTSYTKYFAYRSLWKRTFVRPLPLIQQITSTSLLFSSHPSTISSTSLSPFQSSNVKLLFKGNPGPSYTPLLAVHVHIILGILSSCIATTYCHLKVIFFCSWLHNFLVRLWSHSQQKSKKPHKGSFFNYVSFPKINTVWLTLRNFAFQKREEEKTTPIFIPLAYTSLNFLPESIFQACSRYHRHPAMYEVMWSITVSCRLFSQLPKHFFRLGLYMPWCLVPCSFQLPLLLYFCCMATQRQWNLL
jgi:hypothetical protein